MSPTYIILSIFFAIEKDFRVYLLLSPRMRIVSYIVLKCIISVRPFNVQQNETTENIFDPLKIYRRQ